MKPFQIITTFIFLFLLSSCGEESVDQVSFDATLLLNEGKCQEAIDVLEKQDGGTNAYYYQVLSSAYACLGGFNEVDFFENELGVIGTSGRGFLNDLAIFSTSNYDGVNTFEYDNLKKAIEVLSYAGGIPSGVNPSAAKRAEIFSASDATDINFQLFYMVLTQLGRFSNYYGGVDATSLKGASSGQDCYLSYDKNNLMGLSDTDIEAVFTSVNLPTTADVRMDEYFLSSYVGLNNRCGIDAGLVDHLTGSSRFANPTIEAERYREQLCEGAVLMNVLLELIGSVIAAFPGTDLNDIQAVQGEIESVYGLFALSSTDVSFVKDFKSVEFCKASTTVDFSSFEIFYSLMFEQLHEGDQ